jgi:hypothetical protein
MEAESHSGEGMSELPLGKKTHPGIGLRVGTSLTEATANILVNRRMNKSQQMRWSRRVADLLLQVRCAVLNGKLGSGFGYLFKADANPTSGLAMAA